jgi:hypothetical protein
MEKTVLEVAQAGPSLFLGLLLAAISLLQELQYDSIRPRMPKKAGGRIAPWLLWMA